MDWLNTFTTRMALGECMPSLKQIVHSSMKCKSAPNRPFCFCFLFFCFLIIKAMQSFPPDPWHFCRLHCFPLSSSLQPWAPGQTYLYIKVIVIIYHIHHPLKGSGPCPLKSSILAETFLEAPIHYTVFPGVLQELPGLSSSQKEVLERLELGSSVGATSIGRIRDHHELLTWLHPSWVWN